MATSARHGFGRIITKLVFVSLLAAGFNLSAATFVVNSGESLTLDASTNNKFGNQITLNDGATLVAPLPTGNGDGYRIQANIYVAGAARIDLDGTPTSTYYLRIAGGLIASNDTCSLTVGGGLTQVFFGLQANEKSGTDVAVNGTGVHYPIVNIKNILFDATNRGTFSIRSGSASTIVQLPTTCNMRFADGNATLGMMGNDVFAQLGQTAPFCLTNFNAVVLDAAAIPAGSTVKVASGRTLAIKPCNISGTWNWTGVAQEVNFNVDLEDEDSLLLFRTKNSGWTCFVGDVTGYGRVYVRGENDSSGSRVMFNGNIACGGGLQMSSVAEVRYGPDAGWRAKVKHWFDAADTNSYVMFTAEPPSGRTTQVGNATDGYYDTIVGWKDTVKGTNDVFCYNTRMWRNGKQPKENFVLQVLPYIVPNGLNGLNYISFGLAGGTCTEGWGLDTSSGSINSRRLPFWKGEADGAIKAVGTPTNSICKFAIMVYGSQQGGGWSLLGTPTNLTGRLTRESTLNDPWIGSNAPNYDLTVDGESVDPATDKPNGSWQIVSIDMTRKSTTVNSFGAQTARGEDATAPGGQNYAEVILFENAPTEAERKACERYLAKKWGLTESYNYQGDMPSGEYRLNSADSSTAVTIFGDVEIAGVYRGALTVDSRSTVSFVRRQMPATTEANLPSAGRVGWYDPDFGDTRKMRTTNADRPLELDGILCRTTDGIDTTRGWFGGSRGNEKSNRSPWIDEGSRNGGPSRHWIVFRDTYLQDNGGKYYGNTLRYKTATFDEDNVKSTTYSTFNIQQAFLVLDTSEGGGTPLLDKVDASGVVKLRYGTDLPGDTYAKSIHANGGRKTEGVFLNGKAWLNKMEVDPYTHGFTGKPEILTLETTGDFPVGFLAYYGNKDNQANPANFEIIGETIFYSAPLSDEDRAKVQDYLMYKWLGKVDATVYSDSTAARVSGAGVVSATGFDDESLPNLSGFTGKLALTENITLAVGDTKTFGYSVAFPGGCVVTVEVPDNAESGKYALLEAAGVEGFDGATFVLSGNDVDGRYKFSMSLENGTIYINLKKTQGLIMLVR